MLPTPKPKGYKFRIYPTLHQKELINQTLGCCRKVFNYVLGVQSSSYKLYQESLNSITPLPKPDFPSGYSLINMLPALKQEFPYLQEVSSITLQQTVLDLGTSFSNFFKGKAKYPRFKKYGNKNSFRLTVDGFKLDGNILTIAKSKDPLKVQWSRDLPSPPTSITISKTPTGKYFVSFLCQDATTRPTNYVSQIVGIDLGVATYATLSTGQHIRNPKALDRYKKRMARIQMHASRKHKGSKNKKKCNLKIARLHEKISNIRKDFIEKASTAIVRDHQFIAIESLQIDNLVRNHKLARSIQDASWGNFTIRTIQKVMETESSILVKADTFYPSTKLCHVCGYKLLSLPLGTREWTCPDCTTTHDRDFNASCNLENILEDNLDLLIREALTGPKIISTGPTGRLH